MTGEARLADEIEALTPLPLEGLREVGATATVPRRSCVRPSCCVIAWPGDCSQRLSAVSIVTHGASSSAASGSGQKVLSSGSGQHCSANGEGRIVQVFVEEEGFRHKGQLFKSLSAAATAIAGTRWNGPRFFGLRSAK